MTTMIVMRRGSWSRREQGRKEQESKGTERGRRPSISPYVSSKTTNTNKQTKRGGEGENKTLTTPTSFPNVSGLGSSSFFP